MTNYVCMYEGNFLLFSCMTLFSWHLTDDMIERLLVLDSLLNTLGIISTILLNLSQALSKEKIKQRINVLF